MHKLPLDTNVYGWLINAAKIEIKHYYSKRKPTVSIDELDDIPIEENSDVGIFDEILTDDEYSTLSDYYIKGRTVDEMSKEKRISKTAMYQRINRIKKKIIDNSDKLHKFLK